MGDFIVSVILIAVIGAAIFYIVKEKKKGNSCIGCPYNGSCTKNDCKNSHK
jgi:hypothetical protein